ncbi:DsbA family protein [Corynebacterium flavescens]|uniref:DsbA family protein n=1 Tax=Corynebacterium flavescens TaxID=28028 RepID=UPI003F933D49
MPTPHSSEQDSNNRFSGPIAGAAPRSALGALSPLVWVLVAVVVVLALVVGYLLGTRGSSEEAAGQAPAQAAATSSTAASGQLSLEEVTAKLTPGKNFADGKGDPQLWGPGGELNSNEDILNVHRRNPADPFAIGAVDAPVVISEFSDFECPFCSRYANQTEPGLISKYVDSGLVRIEWNDFPVNGPHAVEAAKAGRAAAAQGKFYEFKEALYTASRDINGHPEFGIEDFVRFATEAGVADIDAFRAAATGDTYDSILDEARSYASSIGITGTPSFLVGDAFVSGAQPSEVFESTILEQLNKVASGEVTVPAPHA